ncbi:hypothetical protein ACLIA0_02440 [Bacillaceae bacterium W0354]
MNRRKQYIIYGLLGAGVLFFFTLWVLAEKDKNAYEKYLSGELVNQIVHISSAPPYALSILEEVIDNGKITRVQAGELERSFYDLTFDTQKIGNMNLYLGRIENYSDDEVVSVNNGYRKFFMFLKQDMENDEILTLTNEQIVKLKKMRNLMQEYSEVVESSLKYTGEGNQSGQPSEFFDYYRDKGITDDYWVNLLKGYEKVTDFSYRLN